MRSRPAVLCLMLAALPAILACPCPPPPESCEGAGGGLPLVEPRVHECWRSPRIEGPIEEVLRVGRGVAVYTGTEIVWIDPHGFIGGRFDRAWVADRWQLKAEGNELRVLMVAIDARSERGVRAPGDVRLLRFDEAGVKLEETTLFEGHGAPTDRWQLVAGARALFTSSAAVTLFGATGAIATQLRMGPTEVGAAQWVEGETIALIKDGKLIVATGTITKTLPAPSFGPQLELARRTTDGGLVALTSFELLRFDGADRAADRRRIFIQHKEPLILSDGTEAFTLDDRGRLVGLRFDNPGSFDLVYRGPNREIVGVRSQDCEFCCPGPSSVGFTVATATGTGLRQRQLDSPCDTEFVSAIGATTRGALIAAGTLGKKDWWLELEGGLPVRQSTVEFRGAVSPLDRGFLGVGTDDVSLFDDQCPGDP